jgi:hypothetical protein
MTPSVPQAMSDARFPFRDPQRLRTELVNAGLKDIKVEATTAPLVCHGGKPLEAIVRERADPPWRRTTYQSDQHRKRDEVSARWCVGAYRAVPGTRDCLLSSGR